jgi:hypothetical protein
MKTSANISFIETTIGLGLLASACAEAFDPNDLFVCIALIFLLTGGVAFFICLVRCIRGKTSFTRVAIYFAIFLLLIPALRFGAWMRNKVFESRLPEYVQAAEAIEAKLPRGAVPLDRISIPSDYKRLACAVIAGRNADGIVTIAFITAGHFPVSHSGYLFESDGEESDILHQRWRAVRRINSKWFYFSD